MDRMDQNVQELQKYSFLLGSAIRNEDSEQFLTIYDSIIPSSLLESEVERIKEKALEISELPDEQFNKLVLKARDFSLANRAFHDMSSVGDSSNYVDAIHLEAVHTQDDCECFEDMESSGIIFDQSSKATLTTYTLDDSEKKTDEDSGLFNCSKATNSVCSLSDDDDISESEIRGAYDYYPKQTVQIHNRGFVANYDEAHDADSDTASHQDIDSPRSDSSGVREYELTNSCPKNYDCYLDNGTEMKTFRDFQNDEQQRKNTSCYDEEFEVDSDSDERRSIHQLLYRPHRPVNRSSSFGDHYMNPDDYDSEFDSSLPSSDRRTQSSREAPIHLSFSHSQNALKDHSIHHYPRQQHSVDEGVRFFPPENKYSRHKYGSVDNRGVTGIGQASKHSKNPPFGQDEHSFRRIGNSVSSLLSPNTHAYSITNMPEGETIDSTKKKRKKKKPYKDEERGGNSQKLDVNGNPLNCEFREAYRQMRETSINESTQLNISKSHHGSPSHQAETISSFPTSPIDSQTDASNVEKKKQRKKAKEKVILSENIENYQGNKELDELLDFIENKKTNKNSQVNGLDTLKIDKNNRKSSKDSKKLGCCNKVDVSKLEHLNKDNVSYKSENEDQEPIEIIDPFNIASKNLVCYNMGNSQNKEDVKSDCDTDILKCVPNNELCVKVNGKGMVCNTNSIKPLNDLYNRSKSKGKVVLKREESKDMDIDNKSVTNDKDNKRTNKNKLKTETKPVEKSVSESKSSSKTIVNKNTALDSKRLCEDSPDASISVERNDFRFTDIDILPPVEAEFIVVGKKKKRPVVNNFQFNHKEFQKEPKDNFGKVHNFTRNNIKTLEKAPPRSITPPLCNASETVTIPAQDLSPSAFPALSSTNRDGRRNSAGDVPTELAVRFCDDSDLESVKSFPATQTGSYNRAVSPRLSANTPISYAKIAASPKPNCALPSGSHMEHDISSDFDSDSKVTMWKGKPTERRHSIGTRPEDGKDSEIVASSCSLQKSGLVSPRWNELEEFVTLKDKKKCLQISGSEDLFTASVHTDVLNKHDIHINDTCVSLAKTSSSGENSGEICDNCVQGEQVKSSVNPTTDVQLHTNTQPLSSENCNISSLQTNSTSMSGNIHKETNCSSVKVTSSRPTNRRINKSVIFMDKRVSEEPQNIGITFGFEDISDTGETTLSNSNSECCNLSSSTTDVAQIADTVNIKSNQDRQNTSAFEESHNTFLDSEIIINKKFMNKILPKTVTRLNGISQTVVSHSKIDSKENVIENSKSIPATGIQGDELCQFFTYGDFIPQISSNSSTSINTVRNKPYLRYLEKSGGGKFDVYEAALLLKKEWEKIEDLQHKQPDAVHVFCI